MRPIVETAREMDRPPESRGYEKIEPTPTQERIKQKFIGMEQQQVERQRRLSLEERQSISFYTRIGYAQYAGEYAPFTIPEGYKVEAITKTPMGLEVTFKAPEQPKGVAETILSWKFPFYTGPSLMDIIGRPETKKLPQTATTTEFGKIIGITVHPLSGFAGLIASVESPVYTLGRLAGLPTPRPPPTFSGGLIGKGLQAGLGWESTELERTMSYGPQYAAGTIFGDIFVSYLTGKGVSKIAKPLTSRISAKAESWLTKKYLGKGPLAWQGWKEKLVMRVTGARPYVARGEITLPQLTGEISLQKLQVSQAAWEMTRSPRMGGVWLRNLGLAPSKTTVLPHLISRAGAISIGYLREFSFVEEPMWKRGLLPYVTQTQVTRMGILPYIPQAITTTGKHGINYLAIGFAITALAKVKRGPYVMRVGTMLKPLPSLIVQPEFKKKERQIVSPKVWWPGLALTREKFRAFTIERPKPKEREKIVPIFKLPTPPIQARAHIQKHLVWQRPEQIQPTPQIPTQIPSIPMPTPTIPTIPTPPIPPYRLPHGGQGVSRGRRGLFGAWFKRTHQIKTAEQMMQTFTGSRRKTRKRKKKTKGVKLFGF